MRKTETYTLRKGGTIEVHHVTEDTAGTVEVVGGYRNVTDGDVLIQTGRPDVWDITTHSALNQMAYRDSDDDSEEPVEDATDMDPTPMFHPSEHSAAEVREFLASLNPDIEQEEINRVVVEEVSGKNRKSALVGVE